MLRFASLVELSFSQRKNLLNHPKLKFYHGVIGDVRDFSVTRLQQISRVVGIQCTESYLFQDDHWCGVRFTLGMMRAEWFLGSDRVQFFREFQLVDQASLPVSIAADTSKRRAA